MSEFIAVMGGSGNEYTVSEHTTARVLTGAPEAVRARLVYALESLGYIVVSENPVQARRPRRKDIVRADFTDHSRRLAVGLRQAGASATQATFDFAVSHGGFVTKGDMLTLEREADAVVALASAPPATGTCLSCGTENGEGGRFCRLCGAPNASGVPAEVEVLRLTAATRAGLQEIVGGFLIAGLLLAAALLLIFTGRPKTVNVGWGVFAVGELVGWWMALYGMARIHRALNRQPVAKLLPAAAAAPPPFAQARDAALPPGNFSVTEGTTELLTPKAREAERVPLRRKEPSDTNPFA